MSSQVCFQTCVFTTVKGTVRCSAAAVASCMFMRHLRWTWFEFSWLCFFHCHDSHKHLQEMSGIGLWICCLTGHLPYVFEYMDVFHICHGGCLCIMYVFLSKTEGYAALLHMLIAVCRSVRHPTRGVCINAVKMTCSWVECYEWEDCLRCGQSVYCTHTYKANNKDWSFVCGSIFMYISRKKAAQKGGTVFIVRWEDECVSYGLGRLMFLGPV